MRRFLVIVMMLSLLLPGCKRTGSEETVTFYYLLEQYQFDAQPESVIGSETRESSGYRGYLSYQLTLYLRGPLEDGLRSPFPAGTQILSAENKNGQIQLTLSDVSEKLNDTDFTLACACLTLTCLELTGAESVTITSGSRTLSMNRSSLLLFDSSPAAQTEESK